MQIVEGHFVFAASDLNNFLECEYLTHLDELVARGLKSKPERDDPTAELIARKGEEHEHRHVERLRAETPGGLTIFERPDRSLAGFRDAQERTIEAMERGDRLIFQGTFFDGQFLGHPDFLRRVDVPSGRWQWSYEVIDTKLAVNPKPYFIIQLCNYSEHLARIQQSDPEYGAIVLGSGEERRYRLNEFAAYYRRIKQRFIASAQSANSLPSLYPNKCAHCPTCKWNAECSSRREGDDHLSLVAWMRRDQVERLGSKGIATVVDLAAARDDQRPERMNPVTFAKLRRQATMQVRGRSEGPVHELIEHEPFNGFGLMPKPQAGDVFFDMEGDPLYEPARGLEYLFGCWLPDDEPRYKAFWALTRTEEKRAFEQFIDFIVDRRLRYPQMHVYHYADYEKSALRRLAQAHCTRETEVDELLRAEVLVDLYAVVRQSVVISESSYSIKRLEKFYAFKRLTEVKKGDDSIVMFEQWLVDRTRVEILHDIERYNEDDCRSTLLLRDWLLERREEAQAKSGVSIPFHEPKLVCHENSTPGCKKCSDREKIRREERQTSDLQRKLLDGVTAPQSASEYALMSDDRRARYLLANLIAYHRREEKPAWWAFFDRCENLDHLVEFDREAIGGLKLELEFAPYKAGAKDRNLVYTYSFPDQAYKVGARDNVTDPATREGAGTIVAIDEDRRLLRLKRSGSLEEAAKTTALIPPGPIRTDEQKASLVRIAEAYGNGALPNATLDLLLARNPRLRPDFGGLVQPAELTAQAVSEVAQSLNDSYLFIQGPPGSGKSTIGSQVICDLLAAGNRVGVLSNSHKAIHNLLRKVEECAHKRGVTFAGLYKHSDEDSRYLSELVQPLITSINSNEPFESGDCRLAAGTAWLFTRHAVAGKFDYLFIDEAGQVSLADALAVSLAARNIVLLGDPLQLAQVSQGTHPIGAGVSILEHLLGDRQTVAPDRGIFLEISHRMHPEICKFISQSMYEGRLHAGKDNGLQRVDSPGLSGSGMQFIAIDHEGNSRESREEAERIVAEIRLLLQGTLTDAKGQRRALTPADVIVVTPYNAQRRLIAKLLRDEGVDVRVGTVDKFQGQEACVVFYSMATSSGNDLPRDVGFLFEKNRFNVAISRARAMSIVLAGAALPDVRCRSIDQIATVNILCSYIEKARSPSQDSLLALPL